MNDLTRHIARVYRCRPLMALVALLVVAGVGDKLAVTYGPPGGERPSCSRIELVASEMPAPGGLPENMAGSGKPVGESTACLLAPMGVKPDNTNGYSRQYSAGRTGFWASFAPSTHVVSPCSTTALIDSDLGRQFTLVGAHPSGTS